VGSLIVLIVCVSIRVLVVGEVVDVCERTKGLLCQNSFPFTAGDLNSPYST